MVHEQIKKEDFAEVPETCPVMTTCPNICAASEAECPTSCPSDLILCLDGSCSDTACDESLETICGDCSTITVTCPKVNDFLSSCHEIYEPEYTAYAECAEAEAEAIPPVSFTGPLYMFCYCWICLMTLIVFVWCLYNQKINPVAEAMTDIIPIPTVDDKQESSKEFDEKCDWMQIGYKKHWVGYSISLLVWATLWGIQVLLLVLTNSYYVQVEAIAWWKPLYEGGEDAEADLLYTFE